MYLSHDITYCCSVTFFFFDVNSNLCKYQNFTAKRCARRVYSEKKKRFFTLIFVPEKCVSLHVYVQSSRAAAFHQRKQTKQREKFD